jgi:glucokinase
MRNDYYIGIDIGGTSAKIGLLDYSGIIKEKTQVPTKRTLDWKEIMDDFIKPVKKWIDDGYNVKAIGMGAPGFVNKKTGILYNSENIPGLLNASFLGYVKDKFNLPVFADNDATCAAIAEHMFGSGKEFNDFVLVTIGTGIGAGLILNGSVYRGVDGYAGELGHMIIQDEGRDCTCGNKGCIEAYSSASSIIKSIRDGIRKGYITSYDGINDKDINAKLIFEKAIKGDLHSIDAVDNAARFLGKTLGGVINLLNLEAIILGGGVAESGDFFIKKIWFYLEQTAWFVFTKNLRILPAKLLNDAGIIGAASLAITELKSSGCDDSIDKKL